MLDLEGLVEFIKRKRNELGVSQKSLAARSRVSQSLLSKLESGLLDPSYGNTHRIVSALEDLDRKNVKKAVNIMNTPVVSVDRSTKIRDVVELMKENSFSQLPVIENNVVIGSISEDEFVEHFDVEGFPEMSVEQIMSDSFPIVNKETPIDSIRSLLRTSKAVIVADKGKPVGIITKFDLF